MTIAVILCISIVLPFQNGEGQGRKTDGDVSEENRKVFKIRKHYPDHHRKSNKRRVPDQPGTQKPENEKNFKPAKNGKKKICRENVLDEIRNVFQNPSGFKKSLTRARANHEGEADPQEPTGG